MDLWKNLVLEKLGIFEQSHQPQKRIPLTTAGTVVNRSLNSIDINLTPAVSPLMVARSDAVDAPP
jgi:hypothetical protein